MAPSNLEVIHGDHLDIDIDRSGIPEHHIAIALESDHDSIAAACWQVIWVFQELPLYDADERVTQNGNYICS